MIKAETGAKAEVKEKMRGYDDSDRSIEGPIGDEEQPIMEHLMELRRRLIAIIIPFGIATVLIFPFSSMALRYLLFHNLFPEEMALFVYSPMEWMSIRLLFSFLFALSVTIPLIVFETFAFIRPGLYPSERKFFLMVVIPSLCCYSIGTVFAYLFVLPLILDYLITYSGDIAQVALSAKRIFGLILYTGVGFGLIFQIPFMMVLAVKLRIVTYSWLRDKRFIVYGLIIGIAFFIIADPTGISMIMAVVSIALFELGLLLTRYIGPKRR
ncbi:MAG: twin-arginine translocase subunit TatC [Methanophagales archaeon ANME-1-THS]|nr:MAG: twin-arginine translocase subunit TatC [Methanophagales archaeon ANME-1-THS]